MVNNQKVAAIFLKYTLGKNGRQQRNNTRFSHQACGRNSPE
jgi:hypothetical protein